MEEGARRHLLSRVDQLHGKQLSFNNLNDLSRIDLLGEFQLPAAVVVKREPGGGRHLALHPEDAFRRAHDADPVHLHTGWCSRSTGR